jgi:hypothetical protein
MKEYGTVSGSVKDREEDREEFYRGFEPAEEKDPADRVYETIEQEVAPHDPLAYARQTVDEGIAGSDYFIETAHQHGIDPTNTSSNEYLGLLATITNEYLDQEDNRDFFVGIDGGETYAAIRIFGTAPYALRQQKALDHAKSQSNKSGVEHAKSTVIAFNHVLLDLVEQNPSLKVTDLASEIELATSYYDDEAKGYAHNAILDIAYGIRTEHAFLQAVSASSSYQIRHGDAGEDRRGVDYVVTLPNDKILSIDVKSSTTGVKEKAGSDTTYENGTYAKTDENAFVYYPQTTEEDFEKGTFALRLESKIRLRRTILEHLQKMSEIE